MLAGAFTAAQSDSDTHTHNRGAHIFAFRLVNHAKWTVSWCNFISALQLCAQCKTDTATRKKKENKTSKFVQFAGWWTGIMCWKNTGKLFLQENIPYIAFKTPMSVFRTGTGTQLYYMKWNDDKRWPTNQTIRCASYAALIYMYEKYVVRQAHLFLYRRPLYVI